MVVVVRGGRAVVVDDSTNASESCAPSLLAAESVESAAVPVELHDAARSVMAMVRVMRRSEFITSHVGVGAGELNEPLLR